MLIKIINSRDEIPNISPNEKCTHFTFRPSEKDIFKLLSCCPKVELIQIPKSYMRAVSQSIRVFLEMQGIRLEEGDVWGHRTDRNEYYEKKEA